jgi:hypothetical protein
LRSATDPAPAAFECPRSGAASFSDFAALDLFTDQDVAGERIGKLEWRSVSYFILTPCVPSTESRKTIVSNQSGGPFPVIRSEADYIASLAKSRVGSCLTTSILTGYKKEFATFCTHDEKFGLVILEIV